MLEAPFGAVRAALEKSKTVRVERRGALEASAVARMLSGSAFIIEAENRTVPLRSRPSEPTSPRTQCSPRPEPSGEQSGVRLVQDNGWSAVRRRPTLWATPPWARTRAVNASVWSDSWNVTPSGVVATYNRTFGGAASGTAWAAGLISVSGAASALLTVIAPQRAPRRSPRTRSPLRSPRGHPGAAPRHRTQGVIAASLAGVTCLIPATHPLSHSEIESP